MNLRFCIIYHCSHYFGAYLALFKRKPVVILIVCTANITRSPYFAGRLRSELLESGITPRRIPEILSAGIHAVPGIPAHPVIQTIAHLRGFALGYHKSTPVTEELTNRSTVILTMEQQHAERLASKFPAAQGKLWTVLGFGREGEYDGPLDIEDPTGGPVEGFQTFANLADAQAMRIRRFLKKHPL